MSEVAMDQNNMFLRICFYISIYYKVIKKIINFQFSFYNILFKVSVSTFFDELRLILASCTFTDGTYLYNYYVSLTQ